MATQIVQELDGPQVVDLADLAECLADIRDGIFRILDVLEAGR